MKNILSKLNKAFESRIRLGIMSILSVNESADFNTMKQLMELTDGNLASHLKALETLDISSPSNSSSDGNPIPNIPSPKKDEKVSKSI